MEYYIIYVLLTEIMLYYLLYFQYYSIYGEIEKYPVQNNLHLSCENLHFLKKIFKLTVHPITKINCLFKFVVLIFKHTLIGLRTKMKINFEQAVSHFS